MQATKLIMFRSPNFENYNSQKYTCGLNFIRARILSFKFTYFSYRLLIFFNSQIIFVQQLPKQVKREQHGIITFKTTKIIH